jgi:hypothetical protein
MTVVRVYGRWSNALYRAWSGLRSMAMFVALWRTMSWHHRMMMLADWEDMPPGRRRSFGPVAGKMLWLALVDHQMQVGDLDLDTWLAALTTDEQPPAAELEAAPSIEGWSWSPTDTERVYARGSVDGRIVTTGEVITADPGRRWIRDRAGALWRLGVPALGT